MSFADWLTRYSDKYSVDLISLRDDTWKEADFSEYDTVYHVAGIAHRKETKENQELYYKVNRDLSFEVAQKAKLSGVRQFIFLSSMSVYGKESGVINKNTPLKPTNHYGKSKLQAEELIHSLAEESFFVAIVRPPMIYGKGCKGNYVRLSKLARKIPIFPALHNKRSMIYIDNFSEFIRILIEKKGAGYYFPQNVEYVCTSELVKLISDIQGNKILFTKVFNLLIKTIKLDVFNKVFSDLVYEQSLSDHGSYKYSVINFEESVKLTEDSM